MTKDELLGLYDVLTTECKDVLEKKGNDYSGDIDRLRNFKAVDIVKVHPVQGIMVRMIDKMTRMSELLTKKSKVVSESIDDTALDLFNYAFLLIAMLREMADTSEPVIPTMPQEVLDAISLMMQHQKEFSI